MVNEVLKVEFIKEGSKPTNGKGARNFFWLLGTPKHPKKNVFLPSRKNSR